MKWLLIFMLLMTAQISWGQAVVGNNGEGVLSDGVIYLRDLYENQNHLEPYVGTTIAPQIAMRSWMLSFLAQVPIDQMLMLKKLSDAEKVKPGLGVFLLEAMSRYYFWFGEKSDGARTPDPIVLEKGTSLQVLAVRRYSGIRIYKESFALLPPQHRVALILHELLGTYLKVEGHSCDVIPCAQSARAARLLTNKIFTQGATLTPADLQLLEIEWPQQILTTDNIVMNVLFENRVQTYVLPRSQKIVQLADALKMFPENICENLQRPSTAYVSLVRGPYTIETNVYMARPFNRALRVRMKAEQCSFQLHLETPILCKATLKDARLRIENLELCPYDRN